jgi:ribosome biogenesis GTPase
MNLEGLGWNLCAYSHAPDHTHGRVAQATREHFVVWTVAGEIEATISGQLRHNHQQFPCVGDWVTLRAGNVITGLLPRRTKLVRKQPGKEIREQVLAANIDLLFIVMGLDQDYNPNRLERYLILAYESRANPLILLNKADLRRDLNAVLMQTRQHAPGVPVLAVSALTGQGVEAIHQCLRPTQTAALIGSSGTGKSTLVNRLLGEERQSTTPVRDNDHKGRHTTTRRELILMPQGWMLMDLPGLRELQLWADPEQMDMAFSEIATLAEDCRFRDCTHNHEPGCAVQQAGIAEQRLANYRKLQRELNYLEKQTDRQAARASKNRTKAIEKAIRHHPKRSG